MSSVALDDFIHFIFSRPTDTGHKMRFSDMYHSYTEFLDGYAFPDIEENVYDDKEQLLSVLTMGLYSALYAFRTCNNRNLLLRKYIMSVTELLSHPSLHLDFPYDDYTEGITDYMWTLLGHPSRFPHHGINYVRQHPLVLSPLPTCPDIQRYLAHTLSRPYLPHSSYLHGATLAFYPLLLSIYEIYPHGGHFIHDYMTSFLQFYKRYDAYETPHFITTHYDV